MFILRCVLNVVAISRVCSWYCGGRRFIYSVIHSNIILLNTYYVSETGGKEIRKTWFLFFRSAWCNKEIDTRTVTIVQRDTV